jgi:hypothetical protein
MKVSDDGTLYGELEPCDTCGRPKSEYRDHGTKGVYRCWWCDDRAGGNMVTERDTAESYQFTTIEAGPEPPFPWEDRAVRLEIIDVIADLPVRATFGGRLSGSDL